jgi:hypothetical protein
MNGIGIGTSVGLGAMIGLGIVSPAAHITEYIATFVFYGFWAGLLFEAYRFAFTWKLPFRR